MMELGSRSGLKNQKSEYNNIFLVLEVNAFLRV
jgi:hypothetical protein